MTLPELSHAYDTIAEEYDRIVQVDEWVRQVLWSHYARVFHPGQDVLDVACGTGIDTLFLAQRGIRVTGVDISPGMVAQLELKAKRAGLADRVEACVLGDLNELSAWPPETFDGIISAFAGLNTVSDLAPFGANAARLLRPGGRVILHLLNRFSLWEWLWLLSRRQWAAAWRLGRHTERAFVIGGQSIRHYLFSAASAYQQFFARHFVLRHAYSLGALRPPPTVRRIPSPVVEVLGHLERWLGAQRPVVNWGRYFVLDLEKKS